MQLIRDFMLIVGPVSSLFDFLTFYVLLRVLHASEVLFHTGWFVESLATQTLVLFVIRTMGNPLTSRPSRSLTVATIAVAGIGLALPATPGAAARLHRAATHLLWIPGDRDVHVSGACEVVKRRVAKRLIR